MVKIKRHFRIQRYNIHKNKFSKVKKHDTAQILQARDYQESYENSNISEVAQIVHQLLAFAETSGKWGEGIGFVINKAIKALLIWRVV